MERINKCAKDGSDVKFLLIANILISLMALGMALGIQGFLLYKAWKARKSTTYEVKIEAKKRVALDKNANQLDLESLETITMTPEEDPSYVSIQPEVPDLGFGQDSSRVDEVGFIKIDKIWFRFKFYNYNIDLIFSYYFPIWTKKSPKIV